ncbi:MAG TPA: TIGR02996 domain-containing protein [Gemmata sp.]
MDPTCAALLASAKDDPDGPGRLVLADWLTENGDEARAELIRVQYRLGELDEFAPERAGALERERELLSAHAPGWLGPLALAPWNGSFRRGLLHLSCAHPEHCADAPWAPDLAGQAEWLEAVELRNNSDAEAFQRFLAHPALARATQWDLSNPAMRPEHFRALADAHFPLGIVGLELRGRELTVASLRRCAGASWFAQLRHFGAGTGAPIGAPHIAALLADGGRLGSLDLNSRELDPDAAGALAGAPGGVGLERLVLHNNLFGAGGTRRLVAGNWPGFRRLNLSVNGIGDAGLAALLAAPWAPGLSHLDLNANSITVSGARALAEAGHVNNLAHLALSGNLIGADGAQALFRSAHLVGLSSLFLDRNELGDSGALALVGAPVLTGLRVLRLAGNGIGPRGGRALAEPGALQGLDHIDLSKNPLTGRAKALLAERYGSRVVL